MVKGRQNAINPLFLNIKYRIQESAAICRTPPERVNERFRYIQPIG